MNLNIYCVFDCAAAAYMRPFFAQSDAEALRSFTDISIDADHPIGAHPEDYSLHRIGIYNDQTAVITPEDKQCLATAQERVASTRKIKQQNFENMTLEEKIEHNAQQGNQHG